MVDWININQDSGGTGTTVVTLTASTYDGLSARTTSLNVRTTETGLEETVTITQYPREAITVAITPATQSIPNSGGTYWFNILSNGDWTVTYPSWVTGSVTAGTGNATIEVIASENTTISPKTSSLIVTTRDNAAYAVLSQERADIVVDVTPTNLVYIFEGGTQNISITSNGPWTATTEDDWLTLSTTAGTGNGTINVTVGEYTGSTKNGSITISTVDESVTVNVVQYGVVPYLEFGDDVLEFSEGGGSQLLRVNSNIDWQIIDVGDLTDILDYLRIEVTGNGNIVVSCVGGGSGQYRINEGSWINTTGRTISVSIGDVVKFRADSGNISRITINCDCNLCGNIMSLKSATGFTEMTSLSGYGTFLDLFIHSRGQIDASNLKLPATTLTNYCYERMFGDCTGLVKAPVLPATNLTSSCYNSMFYSCTSLVKAPELPATTLAQSCYENMFYNCTNLNYIKCLSTDISATDCTKGWVNGVASSGTFVKDANMSSWSTGINGIPNNWTVDNE